MSAQFSHFQVMQFHVSSCQVMENENCLQKFTKLLKFLCIMFLGVLFCIAFFATPFKY